MGGGWLCLSLGRRCAFGTAIARKRKGKCPPPSCVRSTRPRVTHSRKQTGPTLQAAIGRQCVAPFNSSTARLDRADEAGDHAWSCLRVPAAKNLRYDTHRMHVLACIVDDERLEASSSLQILASPCYGVVVKKLNAPSINGGVTVTMHVLLRVYLPETVVTPESTPNLHDTYASCRTVTVLRRRGASAP